MTVICELRREAEERLHPATRDFVAAGAGSGSTIAANESAWNELKLRPAVLRDVSDVDTSTALLGGPLTAPILLAPAGRQCALHPQGELASHRAATDFGTVFCLATSATTDLHDLSAGGRRWLQLYISEDREHVKKVIDGAAACRFERVVLTVDRPVEGARPISARHGGLGPLPDGAGVTTHLGDGSTRAHRPGRWDRSLTWTDLEWLAGLGLPVSVKGVLRGDDARRCLGHGADSIIVSNHGGRQLDHEVSTAAALPEVVAAIDGQAPVMVDGGIRDGGGVFRALALGAAAVLVGRPYLWGLAARGERGVSEVLEWLRRDLEHTMALARAPTIAAIDGTFVAASLGD